MWEIVKAYIFLRLHKQYLNHGPGLTLFWKNKGEVEKRNIFVPEVIARGADR